MSTARAPALLLAIAVLWGCALTGEPPELVITAADGTVVAEGESVILAPDAVEVTLTIEATAPNGMNSLVVTQGELDVTLTGLTRRFTTWSGSGTFTVDAAEETIVIHAMDRRLNEVVRVIHVYASPQVVSQVFLDGARADADHPVSRWVGEDLSLVVLLNQGVVGTYELTLAVRPEGAALPADEDFKDLEDPSVAVYQSTPDAYVYTLRAEDTAAGIREDYEFTVHVHRVVVSDFSTVTANFDYHKTDGTVFLELDTGDPDTYVGVDLWEIEVSADTPDLTTRLDSNDTVPLHAPFHDMGTYYVRVGVRGSDTDEFVYTSQRVLTDGGTTTFVGGNHAPPTPTSSGGTTFSVSDSGTTLTTFTVSALDADGDTVTFRIERGDLDTLIIRRDAGMYNLSFEGSGSLDAETGVFTWTTEAADFDEFPEPTTFTLNFYAVDAFGDESAPLDVDFTIDP